jgi:hypothetical protein
VAEEEIQVTDRERFIAAVRGLPCDYVPTFGFNGAPGVAGGCMRKTYDRLLATGMPDVGGCWEVGGATPDLEGWYRYWGTTGPLGIDFFPAEPARGIASQHRLEGGFEIIEYETGARTRQVVDNDITYSMPDFQVYHVRDRASWRFYRDAMTPGRPWPSGRIEGACRKLDGRTRPLSLWLDWATWGGIRELMGPEAASTVLYDDPGLAREIIAWQDWKRETYLLPLVERLRPEILQLDEDLCYRGGMLISPAHFREFCADSYRRVSAAARDCGVAMVAADSDGNVMEFVPLIAACGVNALFPSEAKPGNDLPALRRRFPGFVLMGWLEKEVLNEGNEAAIGPEISAKVPGLLRDGRYLPNADHGIQPFVTFPNLCRFMTLLHSLTGNPGGEFPRMPLSSARAHPLRDPSMTPFSK